MIQPNPNIEKQPATLPLYSSMSDAELVFLYRKNGDMAILQELIARHAGLIHSVVSRVSVCREDAEDSFQATFLVFAKSLNKLRKVESLPSWLYGVAYRISRRLRNKTLHQRRSSDMLNRQITAIGPNVADQVSNIMELERLDREVHRLPENLRSVIIERYYLGYSLQEISERMEISLSAVDGRLRRARTLLRGRLLVGGLSATAFLGNAAATVKAAYVSGELISATCDCLHNTSRSSTTSDSTSFQQLVEGELAMFSKVKWATWSLACSVILVASAGSFMAFASQSATTVRDASIILSSESNQLERYSVPATRVTQFKVLDSSASASPVANAFAGRDRSPGDSDVFATGSSTDDSLVQTNMGLTLDELEEVSSSEFELLKAKYELKQERSIETTMMTTMLIPNYSQIPIRAVMKELSEATGIPILFDDKAIESGGIFTPDDPISLEVNTPLPVSQVLQYVLQQFEFDYKIENGIVIITSNGEVSVSHLYSTKGFENPQQLIEGLKKLVPGVYEPTLIGDSLALTAPRNHHRKILRVLALLKEQAESQ